MRRIALIIALLLLLVSALLGYGYSRLQGWARIAEPLGREVIVHLPKGTPLKDLAEALAREKVVSSAPAMRVWVRLQKNYGQYQAGNYRFGPDPISPQRVAEIILKGEAYVPVVLQLTIPEGFNLRQVAARLAGHGLGKETAILRLLQNRNFAKSLKVNADTLEGYLYPATYNYTRMPTLEGVIADMVSTFFERLPANYQDELQKLGLSLQQAVTFASLIELETMHAEEKAMVSEVIWQRLKANDQIGIDAALIYGIKDYAGDIKWQHLRDASNRYNTRIHRGLPPGPIGSPDVSSLVAVLKPTTHGYYYYVLIPDGQTRHHFSTSLSEHNRYVKLLLAADKNKTAASGP